MTKRPMEINTFAQQDKVVIWSPDNGDYKIVSSEAFLNFLNETAQGISAQAIEDFLNENTITPEEKAIFDANLPEEGDIVPDGAAIIFAGVPYRNISGGDLPRPASLPAIGFCSLSQEVITPQCFYMAGDADDTAMLQRFFDYLTTNNVKADWGGEYNVSSALTFGNNTAPVATDLVEGFLQITATAPINEMLTIENFAFGSMGDIKCIGQGSEDIATQTCYVGVNLISTSRARIGSIHGDFLLYSPFISHSSSTINNNLCHVDHAISRFCGSGANEPNRSLTANFSNPVNAGVQASSGQTTTIDVDTPLPPWLLNGGAGVIGDAPLLVIINGEEYHIRAATATQLTVHPWIDPAITAGELIYLFGGTVVLTGPNSGIYQFDTIEGFQSGSALVAASLYGPTVDNVTSQSCGAGIISGLNTGAAAIGTTIQNFYPENDRTDILFIHDTSFETESRGLSILGEHQLDLEKIKAVSRARNNAGVQGDVGIQNFLLNIDGELWSFEGLPNNNASNFTRRAGDKFKSVFINTLEIELLEPKAGLNELFGVDSSEFEGLGTGQNNAPVGTYTFVPPTGWTINGAAGNATFANFNKGTRFSILWRMAANDILVTPDTGLAALTTKHDLPLVANTAAFIDITGDNIGNRGHIRLVPNNRPTYAADFNYFGTEVPSGDSGANIIFVANLAAAQALPATQVGVWMDGINRIGFYGAAVPLDVYVTPYTN